MKNVKRQKDQNGKHVYAPIKSLNPETYNTDEQENPLWPRATLEPIAASKYAMPARKLNPKDDVEYLKNLPYSEYKLTDHWQKVRKQALAYARYRCMICYTATTLSVHHRTYERRGEELPSDVFAICGECHAIFHNKLPKPDSHFPKNGTAPEAKQSADDFPNFAALLKRAYDEFIKIGFTDEQAFKILLNYKMPQL